MKPKFTDLKRYPHGYDQSCDTDITKAWARARKKLEEDKAKRDEIVKELPRIGRKEKTA